MVARRVTSGAEDVASAKRIVDDGEEDAKILRSFSRYLTARRQPRD
jgi:hypothetical protein